MGIGVLLLIIKCIFFRKPVNYEDEDDDEMMAEKEAAAAIERRNAKLLESKNQTIDGLKHPHLAITITPASDGSQAGAKNVSPSKNEEKESVKCTRDEIEALTSSGNDANHRMASSSPEKDNTKASDNRDNIKMHPIKSSAEKNSSTVIGTRRDSSLSSHENKNIV